MTGPLRMERYFPAPGRLVVALLLRDEPLLADTGTIEDPIYHVSDDPEVPVDLVPLYVRVLAGAGVRDRLTDSTFVDIDVWGPAGTDDGYWMAERIADKHLRARKTVQDYGTIDSVRISIRPQQVLWSDTNVSRHLVQAQVETRRLGSNRGAV